MKIEIILPYPGLPTAKVTIPDAQDKETPEDVTGDDTGEDPGDTGDDASYSDTGDDTMDTGEDTGDTGDEQAS